MLPKNIVVEELDYSIMSTDDLSFLAALSADSIPDEAKRGAATGELRDLLTQADGSTTLYRARLITFIRLHEGKAVL